MALLKEKIEVEVSIMKVEDLADVLEIEKASFYSPWSKKTFLSEIRQNKLAVMLVAKGKDQQNYSGVLGYACLWLVIDEMHITNVAVKPEFRHRGVGEQMIRYILQLAKEKEANLITLEVRESNSSAIKLYCKTGFHPVRIRKRYYTDTDEDAVVMELETALRKL